MIGENSYSCTEEIYFGYGYGIKFRVARDGNKGMIFFEDWARISGTVLLYLDDNTIIKLIDRDKFDFYNDTHITQFNLTAEEVNTLKSKNISAIRIEKKIYTDGSVGEAEVHYGTKVKNMYNEEKGKMEEIKEITYTARYFTELFD
jgi:hypothetical protein